MARRRCEQSRALRAPQSSGTCPQAPSSSHLAGHTPHARCGREPWRASWGLMTAPPYRPAPGGCHVLAGHGCSWPGPSPSWPLRSRAEPARLCTGWGCTVRVPGPHGGLRHCALSRHPTPTQNRCEGSSLHFSPSYSFWAKLALKGTCKWLFVPHRKTSFSPAGAVSRNSSHRSPPAAPATAPTAWPAYPGLRVRGNPAPLPAGRGPPWGSDRECPPNGDFSELKWFSACPLSVTRVPREAAPSPCAGGV